MLNQHLGMGGMLYYDIIQNICSQFYYMWHSALYI